MSFRARLLLLCTRQPYVSRSVHVRRGELSLFLMFRPRPTHHASAQLRSQHHATRTPSARSTRRRVAAPSWRHCFCRARGPTRRFKSAKSVPPLHTSHRLWVHASHPHVFPPCAVTPLAAGVRVFHARASWASVAPAPRHPPRGRPPIALPSTKAHLYAEKCQSRDVFGRRTRGPTHLSAASPFV
jgi:hypothetical protein